ncbi:MAG: hypothetical protein R3F21_22875 [Myxococcota bacterium]
MLITQDPPTTPICAAQFISPSRPGAWRSSITFIRRVTQAAPGDRSATETDLFEALTDPLPVAVITELLGVGIEDRKVLRPPRRAVIHANSLGLTCRPEGIEDRALSRTRAARAPAKARPRTICAKANASPGEASRGSHGGSSISACS